MDLTPDQIGAFRAHLARVGARETCPVCDRDEWRFVASAYQLGRICRSCGLLQAFDPLIVGVEIPPATLVLTSGTQYTVINTTKQDQ